MSADRESAWIVKMVPEATTDDARLTVYAIGRHLAMMLEFAGDRVLPTADMRRRNKASAAVVKAWDQLMRALADHPSYEKFDLAIACGRHGVNEREAAKYAAAMRWLIDEYRRPVAIESGAPRQRRTEALVEAARLVKDALSVADDRAAEIIADMATELLGDEVSADSLRITLGKRKKRT